MQTAKAALGSLLFFFIAPAMVGGFLPWWLTRWEVAQVPFGVAQQIVGGALIVIGASVLVHAFVKFVVEGLGTPAPIAPPSRLVVGGLYRHVRNPMYLAILTAVIGQAIAFGQLSLFVYAVGLAITFVSFVRFYEEPMLAARFGEEYETYRRAVPGWWPRLRPWNQRDQGGAMPFIRP